MRRKKERKTFSSISEQILDSNDLTVTRDGNSYFGFSSLQNSLNPAPLTIDNGLKSRAMKRTNFLLIFCIFKPDQNNNQTSTLQWKTSNKDISI
jgi:hypothetical protein